MKTLINTTNLSALALTGALLAAPLTTVLAEETATQAREAAKGEMGGMQGMKPMGGMQGMQSKGGMMSPEMMAQQQEMMQKKQEMMEKMMGERQEMMKEHMKKMENHMANIEALMRELVELKKAK